MSALAAPACQISPPVCPSFFAGRVGHVNKSVGSRPQQFGIFPAHLRQRVHVPDVVLVRVNAAFRSQQMKRSQLQVGQRANRPAILPVRGDELTDMFLPALAFRHKLFDLALILAAQPCCCLRQRSDCLGADQDDERQIGDGNLHVLLSVSLNSIRNCFHSLGVMESKNAFPLA